jgi:ribosomal protein S13
MSKSKIEIGIGSIYGNGDAQAMKIAKRLNQVRQKLNQCQDEEEKSALKEIEHKHYHELQKVDRAYF